MQRILLGAAIVGMIAVTVTTAFPVSEQGEMLWWRSMSLNLRAEGKRAPLAGNWKWTYRGLGKISLKIKISGTKVTGSLDDPSEQEIGSGVRYKGISEGQVLSESIFSFLRCKAVVSVVDFGEYYLYDAVAFKACSRDKSGKLKANQTVLEYIGTIDGDRLSLRVSECSSLCLYNVQHLRVTSPPSKKGSK